MIEKAMLLRRTVFTALIFWALLSCNSLRAQYVSIPDSGFNAYLYATYPTCFNNSGQLDTTCTFIVNAHSLNTSYQHIASLEGAQYFKSLDSLKCNSDTTLVYLPGPLAKTLRVLECRNDSLVSLPALPDSLTRLACEFNALGSLPALPATLQSLTCYNNQLTNLPAPLPAALRALYCSGNQLDSLPVLPDSLYVLSCYSNRLTKILNLDTSLAYLICSSNLLTSLPALPSSLRNLDCYSNKLNSLPVLPDSLQSLNCSNNNLSTLPSPLPNSLTLINCEYNQLTSLPALPDSLFQLLIDNNPNLKCLPQLNTIVDFEFFTTGIVCLPNPGNIYVANPDTVQVCDSVNNPNGCLIINSIKEVTKPSFTLCPNPATNFVTLTVQQNTLGGTARIIDYTGKVVSSNKLSMLNTRIETLNLASGLYLVFVSDAQGRTAVSKLVIQ